MMWATASISMAGVPPWKGWWGLVTGDRCGPPMCRGEVRVHLGVTHGTPYISQHHVACTVWCQPCIAVKCNTRHSRIVAGAAVSNTRRNVKMHDPSAMVADASLSGVRDRRMHGGWSRFTPGWRTDYSPSAILMSPFVCIACYIPFPQHYAREG